MLIRKFTIYIYLIASIFFFSCKGHAEASNVINVALLDTFYNEMPLIPEVSEYGKAYFSGVEAAAFEAKKYALEIKYKPFIYGTGALDILNEIPKIQKWNADLVIGPSSSDQCLLIGKNLPNIMTLSSYASDVNLRNLPKNFYSTFLPDDQIMRLLGDFIKKKFPMKNIYIIEQVDCKQCRDASQLFVNYYKRISPNIKIIENKLIMDNINSIDAQKIMDGHEQDIILVFNGTYYAYNEFVRYISDSIPNKNLIFFSDQDNWSNEVDGRFHPFDLKYQSYRIGPIIFDTTSPVFKQYASTYSKIFHKKPTDAVSYLTYYTLLSAIEALHKFPDPNPKKSMREKILYSYFMALDKHSNWFRPQNFGIYRLTSRGEVLVARLSNPT